jgi:monoamine oxidase
MVIASQLVPPTLALGDCMMVTTGYELEDEFQEEAMELEPVFPSSAMKALRSGLGPIAPLSFTPQCFEVVKKKNAQKQLRVAIVGGGFAGLMAAKWLGQHGFDLTVFEARREVGGRVLSNTTFVKGRITEAGAELIGSFHTTWLELAREYGLSMISRMNSALYEQERLSVKLKLGGKDLSMDDFVQLEKAMRKRVLQPMAQEASFIIDPSQPWLQSKLRLQDWTSVASALQDPQNPYKVRPDEPLWKMLEHKLVNDEVAQLDQMNYLGLLCKVRAGQGLRFKFEDPDDKTTPLMRYWDELEIFRCAEGCQTLAKKIVEEIQSKDFQKRFGSKATVLPSTAVTKIDLSQSKIPGVFVSYRKVIDQKHEKLAGVATIAHFDYLIFAIPPNQWGRVTFTPLTWHPKNEIGAMGMDPAVKFFTEVKERFWIKKGLAPYGGSSEIGQVWEGTDNQTRVSFGKRPDGRGGIVEIKQGIVLSVFAGPILRGGKAPAPDVITAGLADLYKDYPANVKDKNTLFSNWPEEPFIRTGYASPRLGEIFKLEPQLNAPFHNLLFFAGEHTRIDLFGYMEGALRSGKRAAKLLMKQICPSEEVKVASAGQLGRAR